MCGTICELCDFIWFELSYISTSSFRDDEGNVYKEGYSHNYVKVTNLEHREMNELKSIVEVIDWLDEQFILRREGDDGYGECVSIDAMRR